MRPSPHARARRFTMAGRVGQPITLAGVRQRAGIATPAVRPATLYCLHQAGLPTFYRRTRVGISRTTLAAVEAGDPAPTMGTYLRVMSVLGVAGDLALLVSDTFQPAPADSAAASSRRAIPQVQVRVRTDPGRHEAQDLQSLALHKEAIRLIQDDPALLDRAREVLRRWRAQGDSRSDSLWAEWETILAKQSWRKALGRTRRAQELRQASPLPTLLPDAVRQQVLAQIQALKKGVVLGDQE